MIDNIDEYRFVVRMRTKRVYISGTGLKKAVSLGRMGPRKVGATLYLDIYNVQVRVPLYKCTLKDITP